MPKWRSSLKFLLILYLALGIFTSCPCIFVILLCVNSPYEMYKALCFVKIHKQECSEPIKVDNIGQVHAWFRRRVFENCQRNVIIFSLVGEVPA